MYRVLRVHKEREKSNVVIFFSFLGSKTLTIFVLYFLLIEQGKGLCGPNMTAAEVLPYMGKFTEPYTSQLSPLLTLWEI